MTDLQLPRSDSQATTERSAEGTRFLLFVVLVGVLTVIRLIGLRLSVVDLYFDESQYWSWSRELAFGYFSKPPLIAWIIAVADTVCGTSEACVRAPSPLFYFGTSLLVYATGRLLYGDKVAFWAGLTAILAPGVVFSTRIMSTDVPLLFFWSLALFAYVKLLQGGSRGWALALAVALGLGILAKYAMAYFVFCAVVAGLVDRRGRDLLFGWPLWLSFFGGALIVVPNLLWNLDNGLITMVATGGNIRGPGAIFNLKNGLDFIGAQFAVGGPIVFGTLLVLTARLASRLITRDDRMMLAFSLPVVFSVALLAFVAKANGNWAAPAFISAFIVTTAVLIRANRFPLVVVGLVIGLLFQAGFILGDAYADRVTIPFLKNGDVYARTMGWEALGTAVDQAAQDTGAGSIVFDTRYGVASTLFYGRDGGKPIYTWRSPGDQPRDHYQLTRPLPSDAAEPILAVSGCPYGTPYAAQFATVKEAGSFTTPTGPNSDRTYHLFLLADRTRPPAFPGRCRQ